jgi:hypothetical protein
MEQEESPERRKPLRTTCGSLYRLGIDAQPFRSTLK